MIKICYIFNLCKVLYIFSLYDIENSHYSVWCSGAWLVLLNHSNVNEAVETKGFILVFWLHYPSLSTRNDILKPYTNLEQMH